MARIIPLIGLSPRIQATLLAGTQPTDLTLERLVRAPCRWIGASRRGYSASQAGRGWR